jgi:hypothetical protein
MEEIHKTVIHVNESTDATASQSSAPRPNRQVPVPTPRTTIVKKGIPPKPPAKPVVRKVSDEEEVIKQLDNILETHTDEFNEPETENNLNKSSNSSPISSRGGSLQRGLKSLDLDTTSGQRTPDIPEPDYETTYKNKQTGNKEQMGDSGISEGSNEYLDKVLDSNSSSLDRKDRDDDEEDDLPDYENVGNIKRLSEVS